MRHRHPLCKTPRQTLLAQSLGWALGSLCLLAVSQSHAQKAPIDAGALQKNLENQLPLPAPLDLKEPAPRQNESRAAQPGEVVATVSRFELTGVRKLGQDDVQKVLTSFLLRPLTMDDLQQACDAIENLYRSRGYLAQAAVQPQKMEAGVLVITVIEARLGAVAIDTPDGTTRLSAGRAARYIDWASPAGQEINLNSVTRAITLLNEVPGVSVTSALEPGTQDGETNLRLTLKDGPRYSASAEANNFGSSTTGAHQGMVQAALNNPTGLGDQLTANGIYSQGSRYTQAAYFVPVLPNGLRGGLSGSVLNYRSIGQYQTNGGYGQAQTLSASLAWPWLRSEAGNANVSLRYDRKTYANYLIANDAVTSSYQLSNLNLSLSGNAYDSLLGGAMNNGQIGVTAGRLALQADNPSNYGVYTPERFLKLSFSGSRVQTVLAGTSRLLISVSGQLANENLNSAEQFYLGGPYGVRAYPVAQGSGSQGAQLTLEYQHNLPNELQGIVFIDSGMVQQYVRPYANWQGQTHADNRYSLHGAGVGVKWTRGGWSLAATVAKALGSNPLYNQQGQAVNVDGSASKARGWLTASYSF
ncbi:ShlB/FhaC/HecB family hemolysin secretion/activation protein [Limnohabitans radicicola]|uniref:ShlB/FhaC/HecB family hemolysin secretion/activation protein n=1 Tax=Limnohabitans radicicola TaxID=2771427 RepID=A0A927IN13_9BURK|nr:ShlB/FhaC/HecB family hemolysin secretion/activation protein [Limnohabitans radicicola]MBD8051740.1 ShlB/FhaC/HecB family hemolysin secretion/activation protein [Limnohabitans radicicola]